MCVQRNICVNEVQENNCWSESAGDTELADGFNKQTEKIDTENVF